jgi:subtilisin family serine protease
MEYKVKRVTTVLFLIFFFSTLSFSQVEVSSRLYQALADANPDDYVRTLVLLSDQVDVAAMDQQFYRENATLERRALELITALQEKAQTTQANLLSFLEEKSEQGEVFQYQSFWVSNLVMVEAKPHIINQLMTRSDLRQMDLDAFLELDKPIKVSDGEVDGIETTEPGLRIINAHLLWAMGITGQGRLVMGVDTGVHPNHPALNHKWRGNSVPANQAWLDPGGGTLTPNDCDGHGSHTVGTMVGRSLTTADTIGVAIDAEWIAAKTICSSPHTSNSIAAFQWAMDPDGNPATINDMPDVISNSWWDPNAGDQCSPTNIYNTTLTAVEAAGIAVVFSAGNSGPNASTITSPKNMNRNEVSIFSTGAIDGASYLGGNNNPIASFSSRGPSTCGGTGSLLIKPEVSAPGVSVRSSGTATGYNSLSGTSMAAPHVAGAVALLKQAAPTLTGKQILEALYYTAKDLGTAGEDNTYGMGLIDVYAAFLTLGEPDSTAPDPIVDLTAIDPTSNSLTLQWTVPYDSSNNGVTGYDIRYSTSPIPDTTAFNNANPLTFVGVPDTTGATETFLVDGLDFSTTYYFAIRSNDMWGNKSDLSNPASGTTWAAPQVAVDPLSISHILFPQTTYIDTITISNISTVPSTLDFSVALENNTFPEGLVEAKFVPQSRTPEEAIGGIDKNNQPEVYGVSLEGQGGPDPFGYSWIDSNEPNGPQYVWEDIVSTGTLATNWVATGSFDPKDEGYAGPFPLGFNFNFYGNPKTQVYVSSNGLLLFNTISTNIFSNVAIPNANVPNEYIAPFWDDLDGRTQGTVHYKQDGNKFIVQFTNWQRYSATGSLTFQVVLYSNGRIMFYYNNMNATLNSATVGIENATGTVGLQVAYNATYVTNGLAVKISADPEWLAGDITGGTIYNGNSVDLVLTFNSEDYPLGDYSMDVVISSNDPVNSTVTVPVTMNLQEIPVELSSLRAAADKNNVVVNWTTATETNNSGFFVERKTANNTEWTQAGFVEGKGTTTQINSYSFVDKGMAVGTYTYRLKQVDLDGTFEYSSSIEVEVTAPQEYTLYQNYPNPFNPATTIEYSLPEKSNVTISIYTALGELVKTLVNESVEAGYQKAAFDATNLPSGTYIYQIRATSEGRTFVDSKKMMLIK